jgi:hypothetical protein
MFENKMLRRIFRQKREEVRGEWRKLHNEELHNFIFSPNIIKLVKSRRTRWVGHVAARKKCDTCIQMFRSKTERKKPLRRLCVERRIILTWIFNKWRVRRGRGLDTSGLGRGSMTGCCEHGNESSWLKMEAICYSEPLIST